MQDNAAICCYYFAIVKFDNMHPRSIQGLTNDNDLNNKTLIIIILYKI